MEPAHPTPSGPWHWLVTHPRGRVFMFALVMAGLSIIIGVGTTVFDGILNPQRRPMLFFLAVGLIAFYVPGVLMALAATGLRRGWARLVQLGSAAALAQGCMAAFATVGQFHVTAFTLSAMVGGVLWTTADFALAWLLWRSVPWVRSDVAQHHGFELITAEVAEASDSAA